MFGEDVGIVGDDRPGRGVVPQQPDDGLPARPRADGARFAGDLREPFGLGDRDPPELDHRRVQGAAGGSVGNLGQRCFEVRRIRGRRLLHRPVRALRRPMQDGDEERFLAPEAGVERRFRGASRRRDRVDRRALVPLFQEQIERGGPDVALDLGGLLQRRSPAPPSGGALRPARPT